MSAPLVATYRVQFHAGFTLRDARDLVPYLARLGVSHLYASPLLRSRAGSTHGYDVVDPTQLDPEVGTEADWDALVAELRARGMGLVLDIVPNHMGIGAENPFWDDVFANGRASRYAAWFDIEWDAPQRARRNRVVLPILGAELDQLIARGDVRLAWESGRARVRVGEQSFPLDPATLAPLLAAAVDALRERGEGDDAAALGSIQATLAALPERDARDRARVERRRRDGPATLRELEALTERSPAVHASIERALDEVNHGRGGAARLRALLDEQAYALEEWRRGREEINYRRFFDVTDLVGLRQVDPEVFGGTHRRVIEWVKRGDVDGLRIDHVDGLADPRAYLEQLREVVQRYARADFPIWVEKILTPPERLRAEWPVEGTTGYDALNELEAVLVDPDGRARIEGDYRRALGVSRPTIGFRAVAVRAKTLVLRTSLAADVQRLGRLLAPIARRDARTARCTRPQLLEAIVHLIAELPVYRTYLDGRAERVADEDRRVLEPLVLRLRERGGTAPELVALLEDILLRRDLASLAPDERERRLAFIQRLQQTSGPAAAKGVEDTALYRWSPLLSLCEVGGDPDRSLSDAVDALHRANAERAARWPRTLLAASTHDTKRSADVRARLDVLSEVPELWRAQRRRWERAHRAHKTRLGARLAPDHHAQWVLYQTAVGFWPLAGARERLAELRERLGAAMRKAVREAKAQTSWTDPDAPYERALARFLDALFARDEWLDSLEGLVARIGRAGAWNALTRELLRGTSPGVPDYYQGDELWLDALVDPDNRRPVDFAARAGVLAELERTLADDDARDAYLAELVAHVEDGRLKMHVIRALLHARRAHEPLFTRGRYEPLVARGRLASHVIAFLRSGHDDAVIAVGPRLTLGIDPTGAAPTGARWGDTRLEIPAALAGFGWRCAIGGQRVHAEREGEALVLPLARVFRSVPVALLERK